MMDFEAYCRGFEEKSLDLGYSYDLIKKCLSYAEKLNSKSLPIIYNITHLSGLVGFKRNYVVQAAVASKHSEAYYRYYRILKKNDTYREIKEPLPNLKKIQLWILKNILYRLPISPFAKAYKKGVGLKQNVKFHKGRDTVYSIDIIDFFYNIGYESVYQVFYSNGYSPIVSKYLAKLCCLRDRLPQGAPTSPYLSNLVMIPYDERIGQFCKENGLRYTRYSDDITISGARDDNKILTFINELFKDTEFTINTDKTKIMPKSQRQIVTGVLVNQKVQLPKTKRSKLRQEFYYIRKYSFLNHCNHLNVQPQSHLNYLTGLVGFGLYLNKDDNELKKMNETLKDLRKELK